MTTFALIPTPKPQGVCFVQVAVEDDGAVLAWDSDLGLYTREGVSEEMARKARAKVSRFDPLLSTVVE